MRNERVVTHYPVGPHEMFLTPSPAFSACWLRVMPGCRSTAISWRPSWHTTHKPATSPSFTPCWPTSSTFVNTTTPQIHTPGALPLGGSTMCSRVGTRGHFGCVCVTCGHPSTNKLNNPTLTPFCPPTRVPRGDEHPHSTCIFEEPGEETEPSSTRGTYPRPLQGDAQPSAPCASRPTPTPSH